MAGGRKIAALTGGTGFLGRYVARELVARNYRLRMLARSTPVHPQLNGLAPEIIPGSLTDDGALARLVRGADLVIHCAGLIKARSREEFMAANGEGTARLAGHWAEHAADNPGARFVQMSSLAAREPALSDYAASKRAGENAVRERDGNWLVLRPAAVYGPWDRETLQVFRALKWPIQPVLARPGARLGLIHAEDLARAIVSLGQKGQPGHVYELSDHRPAGYSWDDIVQTAARSMGVAARPVQLPESAVRCLGWLSGLGAGHRARAAMLSPGKIREILHMDWSVDPDRLPPAALWRPRIGLDQGFADTTSWYRSAGWL